MKIQNLAFLKSLSASRDHDEIDLQEKMEGLTTDYLRIDSFEKAPIEIFPETL